MTMDRSSQRPGNHDYLLEVHNLKKFFPIKGSKLFAKDKYVKAVDGISFKLKKGETLGIVGESGSGKSTLGRCLIRLIEPSSGDIFFEEQKLTSLNNEQLRIMRRNFQMVFQDPYASLNPRMTIGDTISEPMKLHDLYPKKSTRAEKVAELLELVGLRPEYMNRYPHELSGGQRQRVGIARALSVSPKLIVYDEAVSALDVSIQAQTLNLIQELQEKLGLTYIFISHDLSVVKHISTTVGVMYLGQLVEMAPKEEIFSKTQHPYTNALLSAIPEPNPKSKKERIILSGDIPSPIDPPSGCRFHTRCYKAEKACAEMDPQMQELFPDHFASCLLLKKD